ncbi:hypothetical protein B0H14DRAFT_2732269, partial [Mycena olivaceomarginata]
MRARRPPSPPAEHSIRQKYPRRRIRRLRPLVIIRGVRLISWALVAVTRIWLEEGEGVEKWGDQPVLPLLGMRLGLDGSPSPSASRSSFVIILLLNRWRTGDGLFYLDPHHSRPAVPLRPFAAEPAPSIPRSLLPHCTGTARTSDARCPPLTADPRAPNPAAGI